MGAKSQVSEQNTDQNKTILIINSITSKIEYLRSILEEEYEIITATTELNGLELAVRGNPDLIILDTKLPTLDGFDICISLKDNVLTRNIPIIFVPSIVRKGDEIIGLTSGGIDFIALPFDENVFRKRISNFVSMKKYCDVLETLSYIDSLTGISNRRWFDKCLDQEWRRGMRNARPISLIMIDVDQYKSYNDNYGHIAGDECLYRVAQEINNCLFRPADLLARYGGDEFACILPETKTKEALTIAQRFLVNINSLSIPQSSSGLKNYVSISMGIATLIPERGLSPVDLINRADEQLLKVKKNRNSNIKYGVASLLSVEEIDRKDNVC